MRGVLVGASCRVAAGHLTQAFGQRRTADGVASDDENRVVTGDRADDVMQLGAIDG
jgi:hypothetical protein